MKILLWVLGTLTLLALLYGLAQYIASERIEVVELHTVNTEGGDETTRLWVVDHEGHAYLRAGDASSGWLRRMQATPQVEMTRGGERRFYTYRPRLEVLPRINELMQEKYTWGDSWIEFSMGGRDSSIPVELTLVTPH